MGAELQGKNGSALRGQPHAVRCNTVAFQFSLVFGWLGQKRAQGYTPEQPAFKFDENCWRGQREAHK